MPAYIGEPLDGYNANSTIECQVMMDVYGDEVAVPLLNGGIKEEWFAGTCEFDVTTNGTFIGHAPEVVYENIDTAGTNTIVSPGVLYTDSEEQSWMYAADAEGNSNYIKCSLGCDLNGFDALVPTAPSGTLDCWVGGSAVHEFDVTDYKTIQINAYNSYIYESVDVLPEYPAESTVYMLPDGTQWMKAYSGIDEYGSTYGTKCVQCYIDCDAYGGDSPAPIVPESSGPDVPTFSTWESMLDAVGNLNINDGDIVYYDATGGDTAGTYLMTYTNEDGYDFNVQVTCYAIPEYYIASIANNADGSSIGMVEPVNEILQHKQSTLLSGNANTIIDTQLSTVRSGCFYSYSNLNTVSFPNATAVYSNAFYNCTNLISVSIPRANSIGTYGFQSCSKLPSIILPNVTSIAQGAFYGCSKLASIVVGTNKTSVCSLSNANAFTNTPIANGTGFIFVPDNLVDKYKSATNWTTYSAQIKGISEFSY